MVHGLFIVKARAMVPSFSDGLFSIMWKLPTPVLLSSWLGNQAQPPLQHVNILSYRHGIPTHYNLLRHQDHISENTSGENSMDGSYLPKQAWVRGDVDKNLKPSQFTATPERNPAGNPKSI